jgi:hypothetical protein
MHQSMHRPLQNHKYGRSQAALTCLAVQDVNRSVMARS